ncbi:hypothetical protein A1D31_22620 [Bradyrhizobium liaoningense]|nr:hypothetical protein A1D31_22620 [Bradyrhizobium liaoningense]
MEQDSMMEFLTRAWGREIRKAGVTAMSEVKATRKMLSLEQVLEIVPISRATLQRMIRTKDFPSAHYISPNRRVWYEDEISEWQDALPASSARKKGKAR